MAYNNPDRTDYDDATMSAWPTCAFYLDNDAKLDIILCDHGNVYPGTPGNDPDNQSRKNLWIKGPNGTNTVNELYNTLMYS